MHVEFGEDVGHCQKPEDSRQFGKGGPRKTRSDDQEGFPLMSRHRWPIGVRQIADRDTSEFPV
jgi:hypothetical protein